MSDFYFPSLNKLVSLSLFLLLCVSCENEKEVPATMEFKTGTGYTWQDATIDRGSQLTVGITATRADNNLKTYNVSVSFDGAFTTTTISNFTISADEKAVYDKDVSFTVRDQTGKEKYYFTIVDVDGNIVQKSLNFDVE